MPIGFKARDPKMPYVVYEFSVNGRVYYVGVGQRDSTRATDRWNYVARQLDRLEREGTLPPAKIKSLRTPSCAVIRALIEAGNPPHTISYSWEGLGKEEAHRQEALRIKHHLDAGRVLANVAGNSASVSVEEVLRYLGVQGAIKRTSTIGGPS